MSTTNQFNQKPKKNSQTTENVTLKDALQEDSKEVEFLKKSITDLTEQLITTRNQLREVTGEKTVIPKVVVPLSFIKTILG